MAEYFPIDVSSFGSYSGSFSGSFQGDGSRLKNISASYFSGSISNAVSASYAATASYLLGSIASASYSATASYVNPLVQNVIITGSIYIPDSTNSIYFSGSGAASRLVWNETDGTLDLGLKGGNVTLQIGQESVIQVVNKTGADLLEADYKAVRVRRVDEGGAQGQRLAIVLAQANNDANSVDTLGLVTEDIAVNQEGFITNSGLVRNIDTTGTLQGETWVDGDVLYLSPTISGSVTKVKPQAPQHTIVMGYVVYAHANNGKIFVKVDNGYELDELHNVRITTASLSSGDLLVYSSSVWINTRQLTGSYGITGSISVISGSIIGTASNALTASYVNPLVQNVIITGSTFISSSNATQLQVGSNLLFVSSSGRVGIRNTTPNSDLEIYGVGSGDGTLRLTRGNNNANYVALSGGTSGAIYNINTSGVQDHIFQTGGTERMRISGSGNVGIGTTTPIAKLHITGSTSEALLIVSSSSGPTLYVSGSGNVGIGTANPASVLSVVGRADISSRLRVGIAGNPNYTMEVWGDQIFATAAGAIWSIFQQSTERLGIGTSSPSSKLHVKGAGATSGTTALRVENTNGSASLVVLDDGTTTLSSTLTVSGSILYRIPGFGNYTLNNAWTDSVNGNSISLYDGNGNISLVASPGAFNRSIILKPTSVYGSAGVLIGPYVTGNGTAWPNILNVSGSSNFIGNVTITGSLIATSFTGSLQGTASWATNVVSASGASTNVQYNSSGLLAGNNRFTFDGTTVRISGGSLIITGSSTISGSSIITGSLQVGVPGTNAAAIDTTTGTLSRGPVTTIDWVNRNLQDTSGVTSADWENKVLQDASAATSIDWGNRDLYDAGIVQSLNWDNRTLYTPAGNNFAWNNDYYTTSNIYHKSIISTGVQNDFIDFANPPYAGQVIRGTVDAATTAGQLVNLDPDGIWYPVKNLSPQATKMLGICVDQATGQVLIEGDVGVSDDNTFGTYVVSASMGLPVYVSTTSGELDTTQPGSGVVRTVGHIYYQSTTDANYWLMKFRPSNDWYEV